MFVECPACEDQFEIGPQGLNQTHVCPGCKREFQPREAVSELRVRSEETTSGEFSETVSQTMEPLSRLRTASESVEDSVPPPMKSQSVVIESSVDEIQLAVPAGASTGLPNVRPPSEANVPTAQELSTRIQTRKTAKSGLIMTLMAITGLIAVFGVVYIAFHQVSRLAAADNDSDPVPAETDVDEGGSGEDGSTEDDQASGPGTTVDDGDSTNEDGEPDVDAPTFVTEPAPEETPETFTILEFEQVWRDVYSYMVRLDIKTPRGERKATGFIIDSRGWVATSYEAIKDAVEVNVTLASRDFDTGKAWRETSDRARGFIATDPPRDLAIISINRDLVLNFTDLKIDGGKLVVAGNRLILARTPTSGRRLWLKETRINDRQKFTELDQQVSSQLDDDPNRDTFERWLEHSDPVEDEFRGAPILDADGQVVAINSSLESEGQQPWGYALPIKHLLTLKQSANDSVTSFGNNNPDSIAASDAAGRAGDNAENPTSSFPEIDDLNESLAKCREFQFVGRDAEEVEQVELFVERLRRAIDLTVDPSKTESDKEKLQKEIDDVVRRTERVVAGFGGEKRRRIADSNDMMTLDLEVEREEMPVGLVCEVIQGAATSPNFQNRPTVTLRAIGTDRLFFVKLDSDNVVLPPGRDFMLFGYANPRTVLSGGGLEMMQLRLMFGTEVRAYGGQ